MADAHETARRQARETRQMFEAYRRVGFSRREAVVLIAAAFGATRVPETAPEVAEFMAKQSRLAEMLLDREGDE